MSFILAFDVSKGVRCKVLYHDDYCLTEGKDLTINKASASYYEEITALPELPEIFL